MPEQTPDKATGDPPSGEATGRDPLTTDDVSKVARLAMLELSDAELEMFTEQLDAVLDMAGRLERFDVGSVAPTSHPFRLINVFRDDTVEAVADGDQVRAEVLAGAPDVEDDRFKVPPALGEAP